jgi:hypothetical protein
MSKKVSRNIWNVFYCVAVLPFGIVLTSVSCVWLEIGATIAPGTEAYVYFLGMLNILACAYAVGLWVTWCRDRLDKVSLKNTADEAIAEKGHWTKGLFGRYPKIGMACVGLVTLELLMAAHLASHYIYFKYYILPGIEKISVAISMEDPFFSLPTDPAVRRTMVWLNSYADEDWRDSEGTRANLLAGCYANGVGGVQKNMKRACTLWLYAASKGCRGPGMNRDQAKDLLKTIQTCRDEADKGNPKAIELLKELDPDYVPR